MADVWTDRPRPSVAGLLDGLLKDLKLLLVQELRLATHEVREELGKAKSAAVSLAAGIGLVAVGGLLLVLMLVHLLQALTDLPLWACYAIVGVAIAGAGAWLLIKAKSRAEDIHVVPIRTVQTMKENVSWIREEVTSPRT
jgi:Putative Actinobacterial Holin-X, holin superfamily III